MLSYDEWVQAEIEEREREAYERGQAEVIQKYMTKKNISLEQALEDFDLSEEKREIVIGIIRGAE
ncbi:hypothetical protein AUP07_0169 [methanogenic archaeon mixed culture ISO4-G1]|nr:hypothetical protein AUP07_0169 [methanogenic archaeon mixed culture ISO4-G1]